MQKWRAIPVAVAGVMAVGFLDEDRSLLALIAELACSMFTRAKESSGRAMRTTTGTKATHPGSGIRQLKGCGFYVPRQDAWPTWPRAWPS